MDRLLPITLALLLFTATAAAKERVWTDTAGRTMRAEFVREVDDDVTFLRGGKLVTIPLDKLTPADQQIVRDLAAGKPLPEDLPATPQAGEFGSDGPAPADDEPSASEPADAAPAAVGSLTKTPLPIENRVWTDIHGNQTTGRYVRIFGSNVVLSRGGRSVTVKFYELVEADQQHLRDLLASRGQEAMIPPKTSDGALESPELEENNIPAGASSDNSPSGSATSSNDSEALPPRAGYDPARDGPSTASGSSETTSSSSGYDSSAASGSPPSIPRGMGSPSSSSATSSATPAYGSSYPMPGYNPAPASGYGSSQPQNSFMNSPANPPGASSFGENVVGTCSHCRREITQSQSTAANCPHCGVRWSYKQDPVTRQNLPIPRLAAPTIQFDPQTSRAIGIVVGVLIGLILVVGLIIGTMYAVMGLASISSTNRDPYRQ